MTKDGSTNPSPVDRLSDIPRVLRALRQAAREAMWEHKQLGYPVAGGATSEWNGFSPRTSM
jgi:hypothetical protein